MNGAARSSVTQSSAFASPRSASAPQFSGSTPRMVCASGPLALAPPARESNALRCVSGKPLPSRRQCRSRVQNPSSAARTARPPGDRRRSRHPAPPPSLSSWYGPKARSVTTSSLTQRSSAASYARKKMCGPRPRRRRRANPNPASSSARRGMSVGATRMSTSPSGLLSSDSPRSSAHVMSDRARADSARTTAGRTARASVVASVGCRSAEATPDDPPRTVPRRAPSVGRRAPIAMRPSGGRLPARSEEGSSDRARRNGARCIRCRVGASRQRS